jgi:hypothetical protein
MATDEDLQEALAIIAEYRLSMLVLENEMNKVREENRDLKNTIQKLLIDDVIHKKTRVVSQDALERWAYYHKNKDEISKRPDMKNKPWWEVKRVSDSEYKATKTE